MKWAKGAKVQAKVQYAFYGIQLLIEREKELTSLYTMLTVTLHSIQQTTYFREQ